MSDLYWLTDEQMARLQPFFPKSHGKPRVDDRRVLSGIIFVNRNGLRWCDAPKDYGPHKTLYNRWKRWSERGIFLRMMEGLAAAEAVPKGRVRQGGVISAVAVGHRQAALAVMC
ncbi:transposase, partial [Sphingomonas aquatica]|uniref:transposase n=1 Tax=Sphingomonas aquatica TaxID=1763824 RepID=UPI00301D3992